MSDGAFLPGLHLALVPIGVDTAPIRIPPTGVTVGRKTACTVVCHDQAVSAVHCGVKPCPGVAALEAEDFSTNGTFVNGVKIGRGRRKRLGLGDVLSITLPRSGKWGIGGEESIEYCLETVASDIAVESVETPVKLEDANLGEPQCQRPASEIALKEQEARAAVLDREYRELNSRMKKIAITHKMVLKQVQDAREQHNEKVTASEARINVGINSHAEVPGDVVHILKEGSARLQKIHHVLGEMQDKLQKEADVLDGGSFLTELDAIFDETSNGSQQVWKNFYVPNSSQRSFAIQTQQLHPPMSKPALLGVQASSASLSSFSTQLPTSPLMMPQNQQLKTASMSDRTQVLPSHGHWAVPKTAADSNMRIPPPPPACEPNMKRSRLMPAPQFAQLPPEFIPGSSCV